MTSKSGLQSRQQRQPLFAQRGEIAANASKGLDPSHSAEASEGFLLHLDHAQIGLGQIVLKIDAQILQKSENRFPLFAQVITKIASVTFVGVDPVCQGRGGLWASLIAFIEQSKKLRFPIQDFWWGEQAFAQGKGLFHVQQVAFEVRGSEVALFFESHQFPQNMHETHGVFTGIIRSTTHPSWIEMLPTARIDVIVREGRRTSHMHSVPLVSHR
jgi:hypothetical protein